MTQDEELARLGAVAALRGYIVIARADGFPDLLPRDVVGGLAWSVGNPTAVGQPVRVVCETDAADYMEQARVGWPELAFLQPGYRRFYRVQSD